MGPACDDVKILLKMINAGMNVARFNMSHGSYDEQQSRFDRVKEAIEKSGKNVALLLDTKGPEIQKQDWETKTAFRFHILSLLIFSRKTRQALADRFSLMMVKLSLRLLLPKKTLLSARY